jgi:hypothetical protein
MNKLLASEYDAYVVHWYVSMCHHPATHVDMREGTNYWGICRVLAIARIYQEQHEIPTISCICTCIYSFLPLGKLCPMQPGARHHLLPAPGSELIL